MPLPPLLRETSVQDYKTNAKRPTRPTKGKKEPLIPTLPPADTVAISTVPVVFCVSNQFAPTRDNPASLANPEILNTNRWFKSLALKSWKLAGISNDAAAADAGVS